ncbi:MAG: helix-turn-helix transcriptional regulator [Bacteroidaceae bacterium]
MKRMCSNRIKVTLVEKNRTAKWLAEQIGKDPTAISKWCMNASQPNLDVLVKIAELLEVDYTELVRVETK